MKQFLAMLLLLVLCLNLTACASESEKAFDAANALMEDGDYQGALDAYRSIALYQQIKDRILEAETHLFSQKIAPYAGVWKDLNGESVLTVNPDGTYILSRKNRSQEGVAFFEDSDINLGAKLASKEIDGITHLVGENRDYVSEADYEILGPRYVEITMDNWDTYFEIREATLIYTDNFGKIQESSAGYGVFLREEYVPKLVDKYLSAKVDFIYSYIETYVVAEGNYPQDYTLGEEAHFPDLNPARQSHTTTIILHDTKGYSLSDYYNQYAAVLSPRAMMTSNDITYVMFPKAVQIEDAAGTLHLYP